MGKGHHREHFQLRRVLVIFCGGFLGTLVRYLLSHAIQGQLGSGWPYDILLINLTGAFLLAFLTVLADASFVIGLKLRLFLNVGFLGAYTTFSSLALGDVSLFSGNKLGLACFYLVASMLGGMLAVVLGQAAGIAVIKRFKAKFSFPLVGNMLPADPLSAQASEQSLREEEHTF